jgi:hypothetical protein
MEVHLDLVEDMISQDHWTGTPEDDLAEIDTYVSCMNILLYSCLKYCNCYFRLGKGRNAESNLHYVYCCVVAIRAYCQHLDLFVTFESTKFQLVCNRNSMMWSV